MPITPKGAAHPYRIADMRFTVMSNGIFTGMPAMRVRFAEPPAGEWMAVSDVVSKTRRETSKHPTLVVLEGADPCAVNCRPLLETFESVGYWCCVDTPMTVDAPDWLDKVVTLAVSPTPPSEGTPTPVETIAAYLKAYREPYLRPYCCKVAITDEKDLVYAICAQRVLWGMPVYVYPSYRTGGMKLRTLVEKVLSYRTSEIIVLPDLERTLGKSGV